jgi:flagellar biosynthetic protein FliR
MLAAFSPETVFAFFLVFCRTAGALMLMPALGESTIPAYIRLSFALMLSLVLSPLVRAGLPGIPATLGAMTMLLLGEIFIGVMLGLFTRLLISALHVAGVVIAYQTGLGAAQVFDPIQGTQGAVVGTFLTVLGVTLIFVTDMHHLLIVAIRDSYTLFPSATLPSVGDAATLVTETVSQSFRLGVQMAAPLLVYGLVFNIGLGIIARLMPQLQVFFIAMPLNIVLGFAVFLFTLSAAMMWFLNYFENAMTLFLR